MVKSFVNTAFRGTIAELLQQLRDLPIPAREPAGCRHPVVLGHTHAPAQHITGYGARIHGVRPGVDDGQPAVRRDVGPLAQPLHAIDAVGDVVGRSGPGVIWMLN